jgi:hypothetical protein
VTSCCCNSIPRDYSKPATHVSRDCHRGPSLDSGSTTSKENSQVAFERSSESYSQGTVPTPNKIINSWYASNVTNPTPLPTSNSNFFNYGGVVEYGATTSNQYRRPFAITPTGTPPPTVFGAQHISSGLDSTTRAVEILESIKHSATSSMLPNNTARQNEENENRGGVTYPINAPEHRTGLDHQLPEPYRESSSENLQYLGARLYPDTNNTNLQHGEDQGAMDWQNTPTSPIPLPPYSPRLPNPTSTTRADLPVSYVAPPKKDMSISLNGRHTPACFDWGTNPNIIDARFAKEIGATINFGAVCSPIPLPTFERQIQPIGIASVECEFRGGAGKMVDFVVIENFVYQVVLGRAFMREHGLVRNWCERRVCIRDLPIVPDLSGGKEKVKCGLNGEEMMATPDAGAEVNVMSLDFAVRRGFNVKDIMAEDDGRIRFADSSVQDVKGLISVPVSFGSGGRPSRLLKPLVSSLASLEKRAEDNPTGAFNGVGTVSILADFYILEGLNVDVLLGEDVLSTAREFVGLLTEVTEEDETSSSACHGASSMESVEGIGNNVSEEAGKRNPSDRNSVKEQDMDEIARYEKERERIRNLLRREKRRAERKNEKMRQEYNRKRAEVGVHSGPNTLHYHLCPCKLHSLDKSN